MKEKLNNLCSLLQKIEMHIKDDSDTVGTSYESAQQLKDDLKQYREQIQNGNLSSLDKLTTLFAPTGDLQEHAISNGWHDTYIVLSNDFDRLYDSIKHSGSISKVKKNIQRIYKNLLEFLFPSLCIICSVRLHEGEKHLCLDCLSSLPKTNYHKQAENRLEDFLAGKFPFEKAMAFCYFYKTGSLQKVIHQFKYQNNPELAHYMGQLYGNDLRKADFITGIDYLIPVPLHPKRKKKRGYNQAEEICEGLSQATGIPVLTTAISRAVNNPSQTKHNRVERWKNVEGIFEVNSEISLKGKTILLVDDVITSGATLEAIAKTFSKDEIPRIYVAAIGMAM